MSHGPRPALASQGSGECSQREPNSTMPYHPANSAPCMDEPVRSLSVRARDARHWAGMQRDRPKPRTGHRRAFFIRVINEEIANHRHGCQGKFSQQTEIYRGHPTTMFERYYRFKCFKRYYRYEHLKQPQCWNVRGCDSRYRWSEPVPRLPTAAPVADRWPGTAVWA
jgi:hypothetical protein